MDNPIHSSVSTFDLLKILVARLSPLAAKFALAFLALKVILSKLRRPRDVSGKTVLITGAATGIGREQAFAFSRAGANVVLWDIAIEALSKTAADVRAATGGSVHLYQINLANREAIYALAKRVRRAHGPVWCVVNNAGIISGQDFLDTPDRRIELTMAVNAMSHFWTAKAFLPDMIKANDGHIVGIASAAGVFVQARMVDYCTSKFAARGFAAALRAELAALGKSGVKSSVICPAHIDTELFKGYDLGTTMKPEFVAAQVLHVVRYPKAEVMLPWFLNFAVAYKAILPQWLWDLCMLPSASSMNHWRPNKANALFEKMGD